MIRGRIFSPRHKVDYLRQIGDPDLALLQGVMAPVWLGCERKLSSWRVPADAPPLEGQPAVDAMRERVGLGALAAGDQAALWRRTGWSLLTFAVACGDLPATRHLLSDQGGLRAALFQLPRNPKGKGAARAQERHPGVQMMRMSNEISSPMCLGLWLGDEAMVDLLLGAAPPALPAPRDKTFMATLYGALEGRTYGLNAFFDKYADIDVDYPLKVYFGETLLHMVCEWADTAAQRRSVEALLARGANPTSRKNGFGMTPLMLLAASPESDAECVRLLREAVEARGERFADHVQLADRQSVAVRSMSRASGIAARLGSKHALAAADLFREINYGGTALHRAAQRGDAAMARLLLDAGADPASKCTACKLTPLQRTHSSLPNSHAPRLLEKTFAAAAAAAAAAATPAAAPPPDGKKKTRHSWSWKDMLRLGPPQVAAVSR